MCRIFGYIGSDLVSNEILKDVSMAQYNGGPDQQSVSLGSGWAIGNNRLAIVDLQGGEQPYTYGEHIEVVFNGEIYNHNELRSNLQKKGYSFADTCDGSILPSLYQEYGVDFVKYLDGMFAIAIIDTRENTKLILATDSSGMKSLYYYWDTKSKSFYFSSEVASLLEFKRVPKNLWLPGVDSYLTTKAIFGEQTMFEGVFTISPATVMTINMNEKPICKNYQSDIESTMDSSKSNNSLYDLLSHEVKELLEADVAVSTINSGGLDSSFVTSIASQHSKLHSFNISYEGDWPFDEKVYAREVAEACNTIHHEIKIDPKKFQNIIPKVVKHLGQPNADPITLSTYALFQAVNIAGFKVALSGDGADEIFGGYDRYVNALEKEEDWIKDYIESLSAINEETRWNLYSKDYQHFLSKHGNESSRIKSKLKISNNNRLKTILDFEQRYRLPSYHLRRVDHLSMAHSVEVRVPFCQSSIVQFANNLPVSRKIENGKVKKELYDAAQNYLPDSVLNRKKQPFTLPINEMMRPGMSLFEYIKEKLNEDIIKEQNIFNMDRITDLLNRQSTQPDDKTALSLWSLMIFQVWIETFDVKINFKESLLQEV